MDQTVDRILSLRPDKVLEIGFGTGLLTFRIAPHCAQYFGTDISEKALSYLRQQLSAPGCELKGISLSRRPADDFDGMEANTFDTLILNSVVQYFPSVNYLARVIESAVNILKPGAIFIGDVRNLRLLDAFQTSVQLESADANLSCAELRRRVEKRLRLERELIIDPSFFFALQRQLPKISRVEINLKRGRYLNEMTRFRYDVILRIGSEPDSARESQCLDWQEENVTLQAVNQLLLSAEPESLLIKRVPNARLLTQVRAAQLLKAEDCPETVGELRRALSEIQAEGMDPEAVWGLSNELPYDIQIGWSAPPDDESYDISFRRRAASVEGSKAASFSKTEGEHHFKPWTSYANEPLRSMSERALLQQLRSYVKEKLPEYMIPSAYVVMEELPQTSSRKVNRRALPALGPTRPALERAFVAPRTTTEQKLAEIWIEVLGVEEVGVHDNFFDLGGHSLLATQVIARTRKAFGLNLPLRSLFDNQTIAGMATQLAEERFGDVAPQIIARRETGAAIPLSYAQQRLWFLNQLFPTSTFYNLDNSARLRFPLNLQAARQSINEMLRRHEALRTSFQVIEGHPM
ncbi:MAG: phosphopantetheine-binding protein, partial [Pyrinomonadaceae bacterium]